MVNKRKGRKKELKVAVSWAMVLDVANIFVLLLVYTVTW